MGESPLDFDFSEAGPGLREVRGDDVGGEVDEPWRDLLIFGSSDYAEGGGASSWIVLRASDGAVCGLDVECEEPVYVFNSTVDRFIRTFALLDEYLGRVRPLPSDIGGLVERIDPACYPRSYWHSLIDYLTAAY